MTEDQLLRALAVRGARLVKQDDTRYRLDGAKRRGAGEWPAAMIEDAIARGWLAEGGGGLVLAASGRRHLRHRLSDVDTATSPPRETVAATVTDDDGILRQVQVNADESPLAWLRRRRGPDGRPMIDAAEFAAGERFRSDYTRGRILPRVTANWDAAVAGRRRGGGAGGMADLTDAALGARRRVEKAVAAVGPELGGLLVDFCCFLKGLETIERERRWPARSAKVVLTVGLTALARHYGLAATASGRGRAPAILHWGTEDFRPTMD